MPLPTESLVSLFALFFSNFSVKNYIEINSDITPNRYAV